ncbi:histidinol-phosphate transaminase [Patiriisocius hiemis]|uniref:Histidinol-phosphate aminotransferase n=1 Tax=Patiriisocius hiemis TaxID=3075604 RepID=A0ABU2Y9U7_9FLAO|nr:histidinol-phosphate transaminase [Constantimarinum sp. W242]MDT0554958.1 histidinol-phosphate transaminase [Constantimarinum sp. W242]
MKQNFNLDKLIRANVKNLAPYSSARDEFTDFDKEMIFLDANENPFDTDINRYPDPQQKQLKIKISAIKNLSIDSILLGNGSDEVLDLLFRAFCEPNKDNVITLPPTYGMYKVLAGINTVENREVFLNEDFSLNVHEILKTQDINSKLLFICSPNNPTGNIFSEENITELLNNFNGIVVIDEAYIDFARSESWIQRLSEYENLIVTQTFSKAYGMAGIRLGMCFASSKIIEVLNKIKPPYNVNELTQERALNVLNDNNKINNEIYSLKVNKEFLFKELLQVNWVQKIYPSEANFLLVKVDNATKRYTQLIESGIVVRNRSTQPLCENTLRITVGTKEETNRLISVLQNI